MPATHKYKVDIAKAVRHGRATVSDFRLSVALKHLNPDDHTVLLTVEHPETGKTYSLRLCGAIVGFDAKGNRIDAHTLTTDQAEKLDNEAEGGGVDIINNPWFEWQDETGKAMGGAVLRDRYQPGERSRGIAGAARFSESEERGVAWLSATWHGRRSAPRCGR